MSASDHVSSLFSNLSTMLHEQLLLDCTLVCDGQVIRAHKVILSLASDYFKKAFTSFSSTCQSTAIIIKDMPFHHLKAIVDYIYTGHLSYDSNLVSLMQSADCLKVDSLVHHLVSLSDAAASKALVYQQQRSSSSPHQQEQSRVTHSPYHQSTGVNQREEVTQHHHQRHHHHHNQSAAVEKVLHQRSISPTVATASVPLMSASGSLKNLQMILPLNQSTSPEAAHASTLAQALTNCALSLRKEPNQSNHCIHNVSSTGDDDSNNSIMSNSEGSKVSTVVSAVTAATSCAPKSSVHQMTRNADETVEPKCKNGAEIWRSCDLEEDLDDGGRSPVDLTASNSKLFHSSSEQSHNLKLNNNCSNSGGKLHYPPKARHFYANGNLLKSHHSSSNNSVSVSNESISPSSSSQSPSNVPTFDQSTINSTMQLHNRIFSSSNHKLSSSDNLSSLSKSNALLIDESVGDMNTRRDSLSSGENITLKRGRGRPPRYSIDDENWHSRLRSVMHCNEIECNETTAVKLELGGVNNTSNVNSINCSVSGNNSGSSNMMSSESKGATASAITGASKRIKLTFDSSSGSLRGRKPKLDYSTSSREVSGKNKCPHCPQVYYSTQAMSDHINNVHSKNRFKYVCQTCYKEFSWNISLKKHVRKAHGEESLISSLSQKMH